MPEVSTTSMVFSWANAMLRSLWKMRGTCAKVPEALRRCWRVVDEAPDRDLGPCTDSKGEPPVTDLMKIHRASKMRISGTSADEINGCRRRVG